MQVEASHSLSKS